MAKPNPIPTGVEVTLIHYQPHWKDETGLGTGRPDLTRPDLTKPGVHRTVLQLNSWTNYCQIGCAHDERSMILGRQNGRERKKKRP